MIILKLYPEEAKNNALILSFIQSQRAPDMYMKDTFDSYMCVHLEHPKSHMVYTFTNEYMKNNSK